MYHHNRFGPVAEGIKGILAWLGHWCQLDLLNEHFVCLAESAEKLHNVVRYLP